MTFKHYHLTRIVKALCLVGLVASFAVQAQMKHIPASSLPPPASGAPIKIADPTTVVMIVNRDSNEIAFMDIRPRRSSAGLSSATTSIRTWS